MINQAVLTGRITRDLELRYTGGGVAVLNFSIANERPFKNQSGERETDFINIVAFRNTAENIAKYFKKGDGIGIIGRIQTGSYENKEGQRVNTFDVVADQFDFPIQNKNAGQAKSTGNRQSKQRKQSDNPFENVDFDNNDDPFETNDTEIDDDSLPF